MLTYKNIENKYYNVKEVAKSYFQISDRLLVKLKKNKRIYLNNKETYINTTIKKDDIIQFDIDFDEQSENIVPIKGILDILFEDKYLLIVNKPAFLPVHPSILHYDNSLSNIVKYYFESINLKRKIRPVNRLDKDTSGIVIFAKNDYIQECLVKQMKTKIFEKEYIAILTGKLEKETGTINAPIARKNDSIIEREINDNGDTSITHYQVLKNFNISNVNLSLVKFILETGRTHQIRLHSKYIGHPILGDSLYGKESNLISRQALHAYKVKFIHPITKKEIDIKSALPNDILKLANNIDIQNL